MIEFAYGNNLGNIQGYAFDGLTNPAIFWRGWGESGFVPPAPPAPEPTARKRPGPPPHSYPPERFYRPWLTRKRLEEDERPTPAQAKEVYREALRVIPEALQAGLLPLDLQKGSKRVTSLPPAKNVDFTALAHDLQTFNVLIAALYEAQKEQLATVNRVKRRRLDEEKFLVWLANNLE